MRSHSTNAFDRICSLAGAGNSDKISQPRVRYMLYLFEIWLGLPVRYTMLNLIRFGGYCNFVSFNQEIINKSCGTDLMAAFNPSHIPKSGKQTPGSGKQVERYGSNAVSVAKAALWLPLLKERREAFSMRNIKLMYYSKIITERIFASLALDLNCKKIKRLYNQYLDIGALAA